MQPLAAQHGRCPPQSVQRCPGDPNCGICNKSALAVNLAGFHIVSRFGETEGIDAPHYYTFLLHSKAVPSLPP